MIVTRAQFLSIMGRLRRRDRQGLIKPSQEDATVIALYAERILPLALQAEALLLERGHVETPKEAALALALHQAEPEAFTFPDCRCGKLLQQGDCHYQPSQPCGRIAWLDRLRERAAMPANVALPAITMPERGAQ